MGELHGIRAMSDEKLWKLSRAAMHRNCPATYGAIKREWHRRLIEATRDSLRKEVISMQAAG